MLKNNVLPSLILTLSLVLLVSCDRWGNNSDLPEETLIVNHWIHDAMHEVYLWEDYLPNIDPDEQEDSEKYFYDLLYEDDNFSFISDDAGALLGELDGVSLSTGVNAYPLLLNETDVISFVEYVDPDSPAEDAGIRRGYLIRSINGQLLTKSNYYELIYENPITFGWAEWNGSAFVLTGEEQTLNAITINSNPVHYHDIIDFGGQLTGYMVFNDFTWGESGQFRDSLDAVFQGFLDAGVSDVIMDLRYNSGGYGYVSNYIAGALAPASVSANEEVFQRQVWNDLYNEFWRDYDWDDDGEADGVESPQLTERFSQVNVNLNLSRVFFLTTRSSASASESLMTGLYPYMDVTQVGTTTRGKCYGSVPIYEDDAQPEHNWIILPLVLKYANADGFTDFVNGIDPDIVAQEDIRNIEPFGSLQDPLLAAALTEITGQAPAGVKAAPGMLQFETLEDPMNFRIELLDLPIR